MTGGTNWCQAVRGTRMFTGSQGGNSTHGVIAPGAGTHHLSTRNGTCVEKEKGFVVGRNVRRCCKTQPSQRVVARGGGGFTPLFNEVGLPVLISASGIPTVFWPSFSCVACFLFLPRLFSWWAVSARATLPSAVAKSTFFKFGVSFSWENMD